LTIADCGLRIGEGTVGKEEFKARTQAYAVRVLVLVEALPRTRGADVLGRQLLRAATSVGANYRAACRAKSLPDFIAKLGIVEEEADESLYWMELLIKSGLSRRDQIAALMTEGNELVAMTVASINTARQRLERQRKSRQLREEPD
jgi:four helix bundle protein